MPPNKKQKLAVPVTVVKAKSHRKKKKKCLPEKKLIDVAASGYACDTTGSVTALNLCPTGDDELARDGKQIEVLTCHLQGYIAPQDSTAGTSLCRVLVVWDAQPNGALAAVTDILTAATSIANTNLNNRRRFTILRDGRFVLGQISSTATQSYAHSPGAHVYNEFIKVDRETLFNGTAANISNITTGALLLVTIGNQAVNAGGTAILSSRVRFVDH